MLTIGIANIVLAMLGIGLLISGSVRRSTNRVIAAWICWAVAVLIGVVAWLAKS